MPHAMASIMTRPKGSGQFAPITWDEALDDIANAVGIRKPSLYHYIRTKEEFADCQLHIEWAAPAKPGSR